MKPWPLQSSLSCRHSVCRSDASGESHGVVIPNHLGVHAEITPMPPFVVVLIILPVTRGVCSVRVCVCVSYTTAVMKLTLQITQLKQIGSENVQDL